VLQEAELSGQLIQRTTSEAPQRRYVLHRTGCTQEDDQLLREGRGWLCARRRQDRLDPARAGWMGQNPSKQKLLFTASVGSFLRYLVPLRRNEREPVEEKRVAYSEHHAKRFNANVHPQHNALRC
jgi:hypothetical protein